MDQVETSVKKLLDERAKALFAKDAEQSQKFFTDDALLFDLAPPLIHQDKPAQNIKEMAEWFDTWEGPIRVENEDVKITSSGDVAFVTTLTHIMGTKKKHRQKVDLWSRTTLGLKKISGEWKIAHEHASVPFYMDGSDRAALDLKPH